jgi:glutamate--cysteine ligase
MALLCDPSPADAKSAPITDKRPLVEYLEAGSKPRELWRIGTEHEKFVFRLEDLGPVPYEGPNGIAALLEGLRRFGWQPVYEDGRIVALQEGRGGSITLEPGGQVELSGAQLKTIHQTCDETQEHLREVRDVNQELGIGMIGLGFQPKWRREEIPWMPKARYRIMRDYMPRRGNLGLDMMTRTCTVQVNLDFEDEACMVRKFRVGLALQPIATALFANSPFTDGKPNGFQSYRSHVWTDTDPDRCGDLPFVFEDGFGFERYVDFLLDIPMYGVKRGGTYVDAAGQSFRDFMAGRLPALPGEYPTIDDWVEQLTMAFPEVRLKKYLEMRGADGGPWRRLCALPAFWVGLLYDGDSLSAAWDLVKDWTDEERAALRRDVPRHGLRTPFRDRSVRDIALEVLALARHGLERRGRKDGFGETEAHFLTALELIAESGESPADKKLRLFRESWNGAVDPLFREFAY